MNGRVTFVIPTRNRLDTLRWCLRSCFIQEGIEPEILVYDDASDKAVSNSLPGDVADIIRIRRFDKNVGQPHIRRIGYQEASSDVIVSLDDDTILFDINIVKRCVAYLQKSYNTAAVALRFFERHRQKPIGPDYDSINEYSNDIDCCSFAGGAVILRKDAVVQCGLYPKWVYRQGEERFLSIRLLDAGYRIVLHGPPSAIHLYSPVRDRRAMNWYGIRNALLFDWICVPHPYFFPYLFKDIIKLFFYKITLSRIPAKVGAIAWGLGSILQKWSLRNPVARATFRKYLTLPRHGALPLPPDWSPEPLVKLGIIQDASELDPYLRPQK